MTKLAISATILISGMILPHFKLKNAPQCRFTREYSFVASGTLNGTPFATAGQPIYSGEGTASGVIQASALGLVGAAATWTATYSLTPNEDGRGPDGLCTQ